MATDVHSLKQLVLGRKDVQDMSDTEAELPPDLMTVNMAMRSSAAFRCQRPK